jgi:hypothetical protein
MTVLEEMGNVMRAVPSPRSSVREIADWYHAKAQLLEHLARDAVGIEAETMLGNARSAARHAEELLSLA